jgi:hypothetical protein
MTGKWWPLVKIGVGVGFAALVAWAGWHAEMDRRTTSTVQKTCMDAGYPSYQWVYSDGLHYYCMRKVNGTDEVVPVERVALR